MLTVKRNAATAILLAAVPLTVLAQDATRPQQGQASSAQGIKLSSAEQALFMSDHLGKVTSATKLQYAFSRRGTAEKPIDDTIDLDIAFEGGERRVSTRFLSGENKREYPPVDAAQGNPVLMQMLERDIREMERLTGGKPNYFRKRIRIALAESFKQEPVTVSYNGKQVKAQKIRIDPYLDDPLKERFGKYLGKYYIFTLSDEVPGTVYKIEAVVAPVASAQKTVSDTEALIAESVQLKGKN